MLGNLVRAALALVALLFIPTLARADDVSAAGRSVVRVVTVTTEGEEITDFAHGSGFAIAKNRIVTNAHVVQSAVENPTGVTIGIVPSQGKRAFPAHIVSIDADHDLALLEMDEGSLPPATLYTGPLTEGAQVVALGYPGNVDMATAKSAADFITPQKPTRSAGNYSNARMIEGISALVHTASIAHGNSGGPLLDGCGRVIGVNSFITSNEDGDATFGFAIAGNELTTFLGKAKQSFSQTTAECVGMEDRLREEDERAAREREQSAAAEQQAKAKAHAEALARAQGEVEEARENRLAIALILGVLGIAALGGAGILYSKDRGLHAAIAGGAGVLLLVAGAMAFLSRPSVRDIVVRDEPSVDKKVDEATGALVCRFQPERSRVTVSKTTDVPIEWSTGGCMNGRTQYARTGSVWTRILVPNGEDTVQSLQYDPAAREYVVTRYLLNEEQMAQARALRPQLKVKACSGDPSQAELLDDRQSKIRAILPKLPNERLVFKCDRR